MGWVRTQLVHMVNMGWKISGEEGKRERKGTEGKKKKKKKKRGGGSNEIHDLD